MNAQFPSYPPDQSSSPYSSAQQDADIVELLNCGKHAAAFELVAARYATKVYRLCMALLRNPASAQDVAQTSLIRVWRALPAYDGRASLSSWIYAITRNRCLSALKSRDAALSMSDEAVEEEAEAIASIEDDHDQAATVRQLVNELPESARQVVTLFYFEGHAVTEVAQLLGIPAGTVKTHLFRARGLLLEKMTAMGLADPELWMK